MRAGNLRHRGTFQRPTGSRDAVGGRVTTFVDIATEYMDIRPLTAREQFIAAQRQASTTHAVTVRYSDDLATLTANCRILFGSRVLVLDGPPLNVGENNRQLDMTCVEGLRDE